MQNSRLRPSPYAAMAPLDQLQPEVRHNVALTAGRHADDKAVQSRAGGSRDAKAASDVKQSVRGKMKVVGVRRVGGGGKLNAKLERKSCQCGGTNPKASPMFTKTCAAEAAPVPLAKLLQVKGVYNIRKAPAAVLKSLMSKTFCEAESVKFSMHGKNSMQIRNELRRQLARELAAGTRGVAFAELCDVDDRPRADELERMVQAFPGLDKVDWGAEPVESGLNVDLWKAWHARHCETCGELQVDDTCYFKLIHHFLRSGFEPTVREGCDVRTAIPACRAYVDQWNKEKKAAFARLRNGKNKLKT